MKEATKTNRIRIPEFTSLYLSGRVIDIGCAKDPVCPWAEPFDLSQGDANCILNVRPELSYDTVYSSHCLEHMIDATKTLKEWWQLVKPGGYLVLIVPHEDLYEQGFWPSIFNHDHKATFRIGGSGSWSPVSRDIQQLVEGLPEASLVSVEVQDHGYDYRLAFKGGKDKPHLRTIHFHLLRTMHLFGRGGEILATWISRLLFQFGCPVDQTMGPALAQIEVIAQKRATIPDS